MALLLFNLFPILILILFILCNHSSAQNGTLANAPPPSAAALKPGIAAIVGILTTIFSITFLLLLYVKHCKRSSYANTSSRGYPPTRRNSGIDRKVIESLPMFRFSSLRGHKDGLECAVCLNKFDAEEVLRLLPKCKHAFHVECVDTWLEAHSTCPLCRYRVDPEDVLLLIDTYSAQVTPRTSDNCARVSGRHSSAGERGSALEIIVENRRDDFRGRVSLDSWNSRRKTGNNESRSKMLESAENPGRRSKASRKDGQLPVQVDRHRVEHRIIISGEEEGVRRWSDVAAADLLYLRSEMLLGEGGSGVINGRSVSEITGMSRYGGNNGGKEEERERERQREERERQEEGVVKRWLAWISQSQQQQQQNPAVQSATSAASPSPTVL